MNDIAHLTEYHTHAPYNPAAKAAYLKLGTKYLRQLAKALELAKGSYDVRTCKGGIAVPGECILHGEWLYLQICNDYGGPGPGIMYRRCEGRKDYVGKTNQWSAIYVLNDLPAFAEQIKIALGEGG